MEINRLHVPRNTTPVAKILVNVVPKRLASTPPTNGVHVLLRENAEISSENSVLSVPISRERRDFRGPRIYDALHAISSITIGLSSTCGELTNDFLCSTSKHRAKRVLESDVFGQGYISVLAGDEVARDSLQHRPSRLSRVVLVQVVCLVSASGLRAGSCGGGRTWWLPGKAEGEAKVCC